MRRSSSPSRGHGWVVWVAAIALAAAAQPALGSQTIGSTAPSELAAAPPTPCPQIFPLPTGAALQSPALVRTPEALLPAAPQGGPPFLKTCFCSCGYPCTTNEDCGPGGRCTAGITCCAAPFETGLTLPSGAEAERGASAPGGDAAEPVS